MKEIPLTQGKFSKVDDADYEWLSQWKWFAVFNPSTNSFYAIRNDKTPNQRSKVWMARQIMGFPDKSLDVDHQNRDTLDNQRGNLRTCTRSEN